MANFKNISLSLANRHQRWICFEMSSDHLFLSNMECGPSSQATLFKDEKPDLQRMLLQQIHVHPDTIITRPSWIKHFGTVYKPINAFVIESSNGLDPVFAKIISIIVIGSDYPILVALKCRTLFFEDHLLSYAIKVTENQELIQLTNLYDRFVYHSYETNDSIIYISLRYYFL